MKVEINVPLKAKMTDGHYEQLGDEQYPVEEIIMGQSSTSITLENVKGAFNSVHFAFYIGSREVNIYRSGLFNPYITFSGNPAVFYKE